MTYENANPLQQNLSYPSHRGFNGIGIGRRHRQPISDVELGREVAAVLLPLRTYERCNAVRQDVRAAAIPKSLVGHVVQ
jgi:hypothetical protein